MHYQSIKWIIFTALTLTVPAMLFLFMAVMFIPAVFFVAGIGYVTPKVFIAGHTGESLAFIAILGVHALIYFGVYYGASVLAAKVIALIKGRLVRNCIVVAVCLGLVSLTQFPVYGGGGHGPMRWHSLSEVLSELNRSYGAGTVPVVYGITLLFFCGIMLFRRLQKNKS